MNLTNEEAQFLLLAIDDRIESLGDGAIFGPEEGEIEALEKIAHDVNVRLENGLASEQKTEEWLHQSAVDFLLNGSPKVDPVENLNALLVALEDHVLEFLDDFAITSDYDERFDLKITIGDKTFNLPLGAQLTEDFTNMIKREIEDLT